MATDTKVILGELKGIRDELDYIKEHMIDADMILDEADKEAIRTAEREFKAGKTVSIEKLKKEMGL